MAPMENTLDPRQTALLVADMQCSVVEGFAFDKGVVQRLARMVEECRREGVPIFYVKVLRRADGKDAPPVVTDAGLRAAALGQARGIILTEGAPEAEILPELAPQPGDYVIVKRRVSCFYGTPLELFLRSRGIDTLMMGGIATNMVIESTVRDGRDRDFNMVVLEDCCSAATREAHNAALVSLALFARVMTSQEALEKLRQPVRQR